MTAMQRDDIVAQIHTTRSHLTQHRIWRLCEIRRDVLLDILVTGRKQETDALLRVLNDEEMEAVQA